ncbi:hypothetical protein ACOSP7_001765 [Xanthoceras sorbifolium]|uniref:CASP-like protein n=1 Tax=Xanthoceras sorbifolium TaxID=99658 RepID=A0ABQ8ILP5_9ROSI|nr:hypothetical protein JRO89_XS01G0240800 [Xanthoceras sorbifolium]
MENQVQEHENEEKPVQQHDKDEDEDEDEDEEEHTNPNPPPNRHSPPLEPHHISKPQSPPLERDDEEQQNEDHKKPPFKPPTPPPAVNTKVGPPTAPQVDEGREPVSSRSRYLRPNLSILKRSKRESMLKRALLGLRVCGFVFSLVSFSVLAADKYRGWALDSFYRYREFRFSLAVNVIAFVYSGFQAFDLVYQLTTGKRQARNHLRCYFDFSMDQMLTYLLMSSSSSAAVRIDDWQSNWGKDEFPEMAKASVGLSFLAFLALGLSSLVSGYSVCSLKSV